SWGRSVSQELIKLSNNTWEVFQPAQKKNPDVVKYDIRVLKWRGQDSNKVGNALYIARIQIKVTQNPAHSLQGMSRSTPIWSSSPELGQIFQTL
ncbi:MAG: hypothetical protein K0U90_09130, partial [Planctomycetes bacterium]|nr:hypothetical protein [Planctomycetota bacterium]